MLQADNTDVARAHFLMRDAMDSLDALFLDVSWLNVLGNTAKQKRRTLTVIALLATTVTVDFARAQNNSQGRSVAIVYSAKKRYISAATAIETELRTQGFEVFSVQLPPRTKVAERAAAIEKLKEFDPSVVATGGVVATELALAKLPDANVVFFMVPNALDTSFFAPGSTHRERVTGVTSDISPTVQVAWFEKMVPTLARLTILSSDRTKRTAIALKDEASNHDLTIDVLTASRTAFPEAIERLTSSGTGGVIMIPDASIYNSTTVQRLLVWGARKHKPVWAFSENIVRAGAIGGIFPDATSVGAQATQVIQRIVEGEEPASIGLQYAQEGRTAINFGTVRVINADIDNRQVHADTVRYGE